MQILTELEQIDFENIPFEDIELNEETWAKFCTQFGYQMSGINLDFDKAKSLLAKDQSPIPSRAMREGYYDDDTLAYWLSGLIDALKLKKWGLQNLTKKGPRAKLLDLGCSTGRVLRHLDLLVPNLELWGADLNQASIQWNRMFLSKKMKFVCNASLPLLPFASESFDVITGFSVFTHIEKFEELWILELARLLKPGGLLYLTVNSESVWLDIMPGHTLYNNIEKSVEFTEMDFSEPMPLPKVTFHAPDDVSVYGETVIHHRSYITTNWKPFFESVEFHRRAHDFQDIVVLRKAAE